MDPILWDLGASTQSFTQIFDRDSSLSCHPHAFPNITGCSIIASSPEEASRPLQVWLQLPHFLYHVTPVVII